MDDKTIKEAALSDEQIDLLQRIDDEIRGCRKAVAHILAELEEMNAKRKTEVWREMAQLLGYADERAVHRAGYEIVISYVRQCVYLRELGGRPAGE